MRESKMYKKVACKIAKCRLSSKMYGEFVREIGLAEGRNEILNLCEDYDINFDMELLERSDYL